MTPERERELREMLEALMLEHRDLDDSIYALEQLPAPDQIQLTRMKRRKLKLKEQIIWVENELIPDILA